MKKIYQTPEVNTIDINIETFITASVGDPAMDGNIVGGGDNNGNFEIPFDGPSDGSDDPAAKGTGRFWDDEY